MGSTIISMEGRELGFDMSAIYTSIGDAFFGLKKPAVSEQCMISFPITLRFGEPKILGLTGDELVSAVAALDGEALDKLSFSFPVRE